MQSSTLILMAALLGVAACGTDGAPTKAVDERSAAKAVDPGTAEKPVDSPIPPVSSVKASPPASAAPAEPKPIVAAAPAILRPQTASAWRPCEFAVQSCTKQGKPCPDGAQCQVILARFLPEGTPLDVSLAGPETRRWRYAADERLLEGPLWSFQHSDAGSGFRSGKDGSGKTAVKFDAQGRLATVGDLRLDYLPDGRTAGNSTRGRGGKWKQVVTYKWDAKQSFTVDWTYPDADEFCEPSPSTVELDEQGRVTREVYADCQINYSEFTLRYHYDAAGRPDALDVECQPGDDASTWKVALKYECPGAATP